MKNVLLKMLATGIVLILLGYALFSIVGNFIRPASRINLDHESVVTEIQSLNRLESASFTIEKIIEGGISGNSFQNILYGDKILLIAHGTVIAGFDLGRLSNDDVVVSGSSLRLTLPAPEILVSTLDNAKTKVYDRKLGLLTKGDPNLETTARAEAESSIRKAACDEGILSIAIENAKKQLQTTFKTAGFSSVEITAPMGSCN